MYVQGYWCVGGVSGSVGEEDEDDYDYDNVETLKVRKGKGRRKERSKMKPLVLRPVQGMKGCQAQQDLVPKPPQLHRKAQ